MDFKKLLPNKKAFTAILVGSIMAILIGSVLLIVTYVVLSAIVNGVTGVITCTDLVNETGCNPLYHSLKGNITVITQALSIVGISLIVAGVAGIIYMLMGVAGMTGGAGRGR
jgi:competence protein ComGC